MYHEKHEHKPMVPVSIWSNNKRAHDTVTRIWESKAVHRPRIGEAEGRKEKDTTRKKMFMAAHVDRWKQGDI